MECLRGGLAGLVWLIGSCACNQVYPGRVRVLLDFFHSLNVLSFFTGILVCLPVAGG